MLETEKPGRYCPLHYYYKPEQLSGPPVCRADTLYVVGGLYGNPHALASVEALVRQEAAAGGTVATVFNGDFHWLDVQGGTFAEIDARVAEHYAIQGNVEAELASGETGAGCGCAYPEDVSDFVVERSNDLMRRIKDTAAAHPGICGRLASLPKTLTAQVGGARIGIVHGDPRSLAGWRFAAGRMPPEGRTPAEEPEGGTPAQEPEGVTPNKEIAEDFRRAAVRVFATTHTGLPFMQTFEIEGVRHAAVNNGAAGLPCFRDLPFGVATRISTRCEAPANGLYGCRVDGIRIDAVKVDFDRAAWLAEFLEAWPEGSPGHDLYHRRLVNGPDFSLSEAMRSSDVTPFDG